MNQAPKPKPCGDPHFAMDYCVINDTVMAKIRNCELNISAVKVFIYLSRNRDIETGKLHGSQIDRIAQYWQISRRSVHRALVDLTNAELYVPPNRMTGVVTGVLLPKISKK